MHAKKIIGVIVLLALAVVGLSLPTTRDELSWRRACVNDRAEDYSQYLAWWPSGRYVAQAQSRFDDRTWNVAVERGKPEGYQLYIRQNPSGKRVVEASEKISQLNSEREDRVAWWQCEAQNTIKACRSYLGVHPNGAFVSEANDKIEQLKLDESSISDALDIGTESSLLKFLDDFPDHVRISYVNRALIALAEGRDLFDLVSEGKIEVLLSGAGIQSVTLTIKKLVRSDLTVCVPAGMLCVCDNSSKQNMITTSKHKISLTSNGWHRVSVHAACANRRREIPSTSDTFRAVKQPPDFELARLTLLLDDSKADYATCQAAVWIVTDDANRLELRSLESRFGIPTPVISDAAILRAIRLCTEAGIDLTRKRINLDR